MAFESLSERYDFHVPEFPAEWLPLIYLYDADLPLFPLSYFHVLDPALSPGARPRPSDRAYGFIRNISLDDGGISVSLVLNKDLNAPSDARYRAVVEKEIRERLGVERSVVLADISQSLKGELQDSNDVLKELWHKVVDGCFGCALPFGKLWDGVFGLPRFIASWNSKGGRKGELIQTHYYMTAFGERISNGQGVHVDFYLLPTFDELRDTSNPLNHFPRFAQLLRAADEFVSAYCDQIKLSSGARLSAFRLQRAAPGAARLDTDVIVDVMGRLTGKSREALFENYNAFNRGPPRSVLSLLMHHDLRHGYWDPSGLTPKVCADMYVESKSSYQSPKVMQLYAQQCFGSIAALPIDNWIRTLLRWPLALGKSPKDYFSRVFSSSDVWGKVERLLWVASQARKVHSSVAAEILWCVRYGSPDGKMRGAGPLSCKICEQHVRDVCPAYAAVAREPVEFNRPRGRSGFAIRTTAADNATPNQMFISCVGNDTEDGYSARDRVLQFKTYPSFPHAGESLRVEEFIEKY